MRTRALPAPFPIGAKVAYPHEGFRIEGAPWVRQGDIGVVVSIIEGLDGDGETDPFDASSVIQWHGNKRATRAVGGELRIRCDNCYRGDGDWEFCDGPHEAWQEVR